MTTAALAYPLLDGPSTQTVCHIDDGTERSNLCLAPDHPGFVTRETPGLRFVECPDCGLPVCWRCRELGLLWCSLRADLGSAEASVSEHDASTTEADDG